MATRIEARESQMLQCLPGTRVCVRMFLSPMSGYRHKSGRITAVRRYAAGFVSIWNVCTAEVRIKTS
jgi:hypothetical protein